MMASISVFTTSWIEASRKSFVLIKSVSTRPFGRSFEISSTSLSTSFTISLAFDPAVWAIIQVAPGCPDIWLL